MLLLAAGPGSVCTQLVQGHLSERDRGVPGDCFSGVGEHQSHSSMWGWGWGLEGPVLLSRGLIQVCFGKGALSSILPEEQSLRYQGVLVPILKGPTSPTPAGDLLGLYHFWRAPCFFPSQPPWPPSAPPQSSHPLFAHRGGCYSLWQQGPWQPASHLGEATLLPWQQRPRLSLVAARQCKFGKMVGAGGRWRGWVRFRTPTAGILGCCPVIPKEGERPPS